MNNETKVLLLGSPSIGYSTHILNMMSQFKDMGIIVVSDAMEMHDMSLMTEQRRIRQPLVFDITRRDLFLEDIPEFEYDKIGDRKPLTLKERKKRKAKRRQVKKSRNYMHKST